MIAFSGALLLASLAVWIAGVAALASARAWDAPKWEAGWAAFAGGVCVAVGMGGTAASLVALLGAR